MKAVVCRQYGSPDVLKLEEVHQPVPKDDEGLIRVHAASVNAADWHLLRADPFLVRLMFGLLKPKVHILGADVAGRVESVGKHVTRFQPGDEVFGDLFADNWGGFAEFACARESSVLLKPANLTFEQAAAVPLAAVTALQGLRDVGKIKQGQSVLIHGASGGVGTFAVQIAKAFGAEVTAVCRTRSLELMRSLGADQVIDYTQEDFMKNGRHYNLILGVGGNRSIFDYRRALRPHGIYAMAGGSTAQMFQALLLRPWLSMLGSKKTRTVSAKPKNEDLAAVKAMIEEGKVRPVVDRSFPLADVPQAIRHLEDVHAQGKVVITV